MTKETDTSAGAVERLSALLVKDAEDQETQPCEMTGLLADDEYTIAATPAPWPPSATNGRPVQSGPRRRSSR